MDEDGCGRRKEEGRRRKEEGGGGWRRGGGERRKVEGGGGCRRGGGEETVTGRWQEEQGERESKRGGLGVRKIRTVRCGIFLCVCYKMPGTGQASAEGGAFLYRTALLSRRRSSTRSGDRSRGKGAGLAVAYPVSVPASLSEFVGRWRGSYDRRSNIGHIVVRYTLYAPASSYRRLRRVTEQNLAQYWSCHRDCVGRFGVWGLGFEVSERGFQNATSLETMLSATRPCRSSSTYTPGAQHHAPHQSRTLKTRTGSAIRLVITRHGMTKR
eukprot:3053275-Rhodomonas_salina.2